MDTVDTKKDSSSSTKATARRSGGGAIQPDARYSCRVISAELAASTRKLTDGLDVIVEITDGEAAGERTVATIWLTENTRDKARRTLRELGLSAEEIGSEAFWRAPSSLLGERSCSIVTEADDSGEVRVKYLNGPSRGRNRPPKDPAAAAKRAAALFAKDPDPNVLLAEGDDPF